MKMEWLSFWCIFIFISSVHNSKVTKSTRKAVTRPRTHSNFARFFETKTAHKTLPQLESHSSFATQASHKTLSKLRGHSSGAHYLEVAHTTIPKLRTYSNLAHHLDTQASHKIFPELRTHSNLARSSTPALDLEHHLRFPMKQRAARSGFSFLGHPGSLDGHGGSAGSRGNLFGLSMYFGNCPVESRKVARRIDSLYTCRQGGNFECDKECENRFDDDDEEVIGGRCLSPGGQGYRRGYGGHGGYTGYGGVCVCFYCHGMGVSDTKCMESIESKELKDDEFTRPLCDIQSNEYNEQPGYDDDVFRTDKNDPKNTERTGFGSLPFGGRHPGLFGAGHHGANRGPRTHAISSKRCNDKCMLLYSNAEKGICKRGSGYHYECHCKTCGLAEAFLHNENAPGDDALDLKTVNCNDYTPNGNTFDVFLPQPLPVQIKACEDGTDPSADGKCLEQCLKNFMHYPIYSANCDELGGGLAQDGGRTKRTDRFRTLTGPHRCVCTICSPPPCIYDSWNDWSYCSIRCNGGTRRRKRNLIVGDKGECTNVLEYRSCSEYPCSIDCVVSRWQEWGPCKGHCGTGRETRSRQMLVPPLYGGRCYHNQFIESRRCDIGKACDNYGPDILDIPGYSNAPQLVDFLFGGYRN